MLYTTARFQGVNGFEVGEYSFEAGSSKHSSRSNWIYIRIKLDRNLPHIVLDAKVNDPQLLGQDVGTNLPRTFSRDQILHLEGDFDQHFTLYAPKEYERDALYIFAPDVMAMLIDETRRFDAEIIDDELYFYLHEPGVGVVAPEMMRQLMNIVATVGGKLNAGTEHYRDERIVPSILQPAAGVVADEGRMLRSSWFANQLFLSVLRAVAIFVIGVIVVSIVNAQVN